MISAHGIGGAKDLPISPELAILGAVAALAVSFTVLAVAWRTPRYGAQGGGLHLAPLARLVDSTAWIVTLRVVGLVLLAYVVVVLTLGEDLAINPIFGIFYVWWWVGLVPLSLLLGPVWKAISPVRTINVALARLTGGDPDQGVYTYPERLGQWPAALGLLAFVWMELVYPHSTDLGPVRLWIAIYVALMLMGGALYGSVFYERADPFEVYSSLVARLSVFGRDVERRLVLRSPLANLAGVPVRPGLVAVVAVLFGSTAFDSFKDSSRWLEFFQSSSLVRDHSWGPDLANNLALLAFCVGVGAIFAIGCMTTGVKQPRGHAGARLVPSPVAPASSGAAVTETEVRTDPCVEERGTTYAGRRGQLPDQFAHSIVPIVVGYLVAHYLTYLIEVGTITLQQVSDPLSRGSNLFGTADVPVSYFLSDHPSLLASIKVLAVVLGHVVGVVAAHDRALHLLPKRHRISGQLPLLAAMVAFTIGGLYLLFAA